MEAAGTPAPAAPPPPPPTTTSSAEENAGGGWRALGVLLALALAFAAAVMIVAMAEISDTPLQKDCTPPACTEYFDGSSGEKTATVVLGYASGAVAAVGALLALFFAFTGRRGRTVLQVAGVAVLLGAVSILISAI